MALWAEWRVIVTGSSIVAILSIYSWTAGAQVPASWSQITVIATFVIASFGAWRRSDKPLRAFLAGTPRIVITGIRPVTPQNESLILDLLLLNPGPTPTSFEPAWNLIIQTRDGHALPMQTGELVGEIRPLQQGDQFKVAVLFWNKQAVVTPDHCRAGARFILSVTDIHGRVAHAAFESELAL